MCLLTRSFLSDSLGAVSEQLSDTTRALVAYENALRHNPMSVSALTQVAGIARSKEEFPKAIDYYQRTLNISPENGDVWGSLGELIGPVPLYGFGRKSSFGRSACC
jgi:glucose repression mediator protein